VILPPLVFPASLIFEGIVGIAHLTVPPVCLDSWHFSQIQSLQKPLAKGQPSLPLRQRQIIKMFDNMDTLTADGSEK
jgi:hypothetical protein